MTKIVVTSLFILQLFTAQYLPSSAQSMASQEQEAAVRFMTKGVDTLPVCGAPGPIMTYGENSFPVVVGRYGDNTFEPLVTASYVSDGRVLAFGHTDYLSPNTISNSESTKQFYKNIILWAANANEKNSQKIKVAVWKKRETVDVIRSLGFDAFLINDLKLEYDVVLASSTDLNDVQYDELFSAIKQGAGFITCGLGWGWSQLNPGKSLISDHPGNRNFQKNGVTIAWSDGFISPIKGRDFAVSQQPSASLLRFVDGSESLNELQKLVDSQSQESEKTTLQSQDYSQIYSTISLVLPYLSSSQRQILDALVDKASEDAHPTPQSPIKEDDLLKRLVVTLQIEKYLHGQIAGITSPEEVPSLVTENVFPGPVADKAERLQDVTIKVKTEVPAWHSPGLYAAPGEIITIQVDPSLLSQFKSPLKVRIGVHSDNIKHLSQWTRYPEITIEKALKENITQIVNPFGGLIYVDVPRDLMHRGLGEIDVQISGAVSAPYFVRGVTSIQEWNEIEKNKMAPWGEIEGRNVIVTVPSSVLREVDNPQQLIEVWDTILDLEAEVASGPYVRERQERICCDQQISAGYMHSGYPVMTHMDVQKALVDYNHLTKEGDWGFYHEFGHNHQSPYWTFEGTTEVTVNYFSLYIMEKLNKRLPEASKPDLTKEAQERMLKGYFSRGAKFEEWKSDPFLALTMTIQLRNEFGWEPFLRSISEYKKCPPSELPRNDQEKRDQWMIRLSNNVGRDLGPFFTKWGIPISEEALSKTKAMPAWIPETVEKLAH